MDTTLTVKLPKKLRDDSKKVAEEMGVPLTTAVHVLLKKLVRDRILVLEGECPFPSHTPNAETRKAILEGRSKKGKVFKNIEEIRKYFGTM